MSRKPNVSRHRVRAGSRIARAVVAMSAASLLAIAPAVGAASTRTAKPASASTFITNFVQYVGGTSGAANPKLSPVYIGWVNQQGGSGDIAPETTFGPESAVKYINTYAGGIDGHPVRLVSCYIPDTVAGATTCGEQMANNPKVSVVVVGAVAIGNQAMESALARTGKPMIFLIALSNTDDTYKPGFALYGDGTHVEAPWATFAKALHAKTVAIINEDTPGSAINVTITADAMHYDHIATTVVNFDPTTTDLTGPLEAADAAHASLILGDVSGSDCSNLYLAVKQLGIKTPVMVNVPCATNQVATADGGSLPNGWYYASATVMYQDPSNTSAAALRTALTKVGEGNYAPDPWVQDSFGQVLTVAKWDTELLKAGKTLTPANIAAAAAAFKGPLVFGAPTLVCGSFKNAPAVCNDHVNYFQDVSGVFKAVLRWVGPPPGFVTPAG